MKLIDKNEEKWYCKKDDRMYLAREDRVIENARKGQFQQSKSDLQPATVSRFDRTEVWDSVNASTKFCRFCGAKIPRDSKFCEECGTSLG